MKKHKICKRLTIITLTIAICIVWYCINKPNAYEICLDNKPIMYVKDVNTFYKVDQEITNYIYSRYSKKIYPKVNVNRVTLNTAYLFNKKEIKEKMLKTIKIPAIIMKCNNKKIGVLANEKDIRDVIQLVKEHYIKTNKDSKVGERKGKITYKEIRTTINKIKTPEHISKYILNSKELKPMLCFEITKKKPLLVKKNIKEIIKKPNKKSNKKSNKKPTQKAESKKKAVAATTKINMINIPAAGIISSPFGMRYNPILKCKKFHSGVDVAAPMGSDIYAAVDGTVTFTGWINGYGKVIKIQHNKETEVLYGHCSKITVKKGDKIKKAQKIGCIGSTGRSTGPHVHFEVRVNGKVINPIKYLK